MEWNDRLAAARKAAGLSQEQLGERLDVTRQAVSKWESGQATPDVLMAARLCEVLHISADYLLLGKNEASSGPEAYTPPDTCPCCGREVCPSPPLHGAICSQRSTADWSAPSPAVTGRTRWRTSSTPSWTRAVR